MKLLLLLALSSIHLAAGGVQVIAYLEGGCRGTLSWSEWELSGLHNPAEADDNVCTFVGAVRGRKAVYAKASCAGPGQMIYINLYADSGCTGRADVSWTYVDGYCREEEGWWWNKRSIKFKYVPPSQAPPPPPLPPLPPLPPPSSEGVIIIAAAVAAAVLIVVLVVAVLIWNCRKKSPTPGSAVEQHAAAVQGCAMAHQMMAAQSASPLGTAISVQPAAQPGATVGTAVSAVPVQPAKSVQQGFWNA